MDTSAEDSSIGYDIQLSFSFLPNVVTSYKLVDEDLVVDIGKENAKFPELVLSLRLVFVVLLSFLQPPYQAGKKVVPISTPNWYSTFKGTDRSLGKVPSEVPITLGKMANFGEQRTCFI